MAYADVTDLEERWRELSEDEQARAAVLLDDASAMLASMATVDDSDQQQASIRRIVCCNMVIRVMAPGVDASFGATNGSMTGGPYTQSWTYGAPVGDLYLTKAEKAMLGVSAMVVGQVRPRIGRRPHYYDCECRHD